jgi:hypothetical protein
MPGGGGIHVHAKALRLDAVNRAGVTQIRVRFTLDDDDDTAEDSRLFHDTTVVPTLTVSSE